MRRAAVARRVAIAPALTTALVIGPIGAGLLFTALPAFGYLPALGRGSLSLEPWRMLLATPGLARSLALTLFVGFGATLASLVLAGAACALLARRWPARLERIAAPLLAAPHVAVAVGLAFLIAPSGFLIRLVSPGLTGFSQPPDWTILRDPLGLSFMLGLILKETPYLAWMMLAGLRQLPIAALDRAGAALGYGPTTRFLKLVVPALYPLVRLPVYAVLAFSLSVVEVALVLAPGTPPPLAVLAWRWFQSYDLSLYGPAAAAALLQAGVVALAIAVWFLGERVVRRAGAGWVTDGRRDPPAARAFAGAGIGAAGAVLAGYASLLLLALWSVAREWRFPDAWPGAFSLAPWRIWPGLGEALAATLATGIAASLIAVALSLACLESEQRRGARPGRGALAVLYTPLIVPQIAFLFGVQVLLVRLRIDGTVAAVVGVHLVFVLPYVFLSLADPFRTLDPRFRRIAAGLGASPLRVFFRVTLPCLARPVAIAAAIGFAVSVSLYLPTLFAGAGRVATLTTETVVLASGADRRVVAAAALWQALCPLAAFAMSLLVRDPLRRLGPRRA